MPNIADVLTDRMLSRPRGPIARLWWRDMKAHHDIFRDTLRALELQSADNLLEIGCGGGTFVGWALESGCRATAVDHSADMIALTARNNAALVREGRLEMVEATAEALPLPDEQFTCAAMTNVFCFLDAPRALTELRRVLVPGARIVVHTIAPNPPASVVPPPVARRMRLHTDDDLHALFQGAGFTESNVARLGAAFQLVTASR
ncbi:class I SAM-dependent methyltransferase [Nocardia vinacea]|uniref:Class I SAM-dependent methyltransferase n=1 Tax=Nocardia vinacea TaxID=96468 RepID=A0ABZ1YSR2_9NOCA|nr:class I SAM-dependent methyltransferase [Nocardia vinacea]